MQQFIKMKKQVSMTESTRLVLNKSIDLLHKFSNKKMRNEDVKKEMATLLSTYFMTLFPEAEGGSDAESKLQLQHFLDNAYDIVDKVETGQAPLYEAIMLMNKVVVSLKPVKRQESEDHFEKFIAEEAHRRGEREVVRFRPVAAEVSEEEFQEDFVEQKEQMRVGAMSIQQEEQSSSTEDDASQLLGNVLKQKRALEQSVKNLNESLAAIGYELKPLDP